jgi:hypothetical protein
MARRRLSIATATVATNAPLAAKLSQSRSEPNLLSADRIIWYRGQRHYSQRELLADTCLHLAALITAVLAVLHLEMVCTYASPLSSERAALRVYLFSLVGMWSCSAAYNMMSGRSLEIVDSGAVPPRLFPTVQPSLELLKLADHAGGGPSAGRFCLSEGCDGWHLGTLAITRRQHPSVLRA